MGEIDTTGRLHLLTNDEYRVLDEDGWSTIWSFEDPRDGTLEVRPEGAVYILRSGLGLLTNESGEWVEREIGTGHLP